MIDIEPSAGQFTDDKTGRIVNYDSTNFRVLIDNKKGVGKK